MPFSVGSRKFIIVPWLDTRPDCSVSIIYFIKLKIRDAFFFYVTDWELHNQCSDGITDNLELGIKNKNAALIP